MSPETPNVDKSLAARSNKALATQDLRRVNFSRTVDHPCFLTLGSYSKKLPGGGISLLPALGRLPALNKGFMEAEEP